MTQYETKFGSLDDYEKGGIELIDDDAKHYVFSNIFEVAQTANPYDKIAVAKNGKYVIEAIRAEGTSAWRTCSHDEFVTVLDGEVRIDFIKPTQPLVSADKEGSIALDGDADGTEMGYVVLRRGHQALLPAGSAYQFQTQEPAVMIQQAILGNDTIERWAEICLS